jgi:hypothetical protein
MSTMVERLETGILKPEGDWNGIFIRGDDALMYARRLQVLFDAFEARAGSNDISPEEIAAWAKLTELADLLQSCRSHRKNEVSDDNQTKTTGRKKTKNGRKRTAT